MKIKSALLLICMTAEDINQLLTYKGISDEISLPPGARSYFFQVWFNKKIDPTNVIVTLNGQDISDLFVAEQDESNFVDLPLMEGPNKLELRAAESIEHNSGLTPQWDYDNFIITVKSHREKPRFSTKIGL